MAPLSYSASAASLRFIENDSRHNEERLALAKGIIISNKTVVHRLRQ